MVGNQDGKIFVLSHDGKVLNQFRLPDGVKCIVADDGWLYAGCDNGKVYDLTGKIPRIAYEIAENKVTEFPLELARRIIFEEVSAAREAVKQQFDIDLPKRDRL